MSGADAPAHYGRMTRWLPPVLLATLAVLAGCTSAPASSPRAVSAPTSTASTTPSPTATASPSPTGVVWNVARTWPTENPALTPGEVIPGCTYPVTANRAVTLKVRTLVRARYHYTGPTDIQHVEIDHKVPHSLCGADTANNLWPELVIPGYPTSALVHNPKDALELVIAAKVRATGKTHMSLADAQKVFRGDWRVAYCQDVKHPLIDCAPWG